MKKIIVALIVAGLAWMTLYAAAPEVIEEIVAIVNDDIITLSQYKEQYDLQLRQLKAANLPQDQYDKQFKLLKSDLLNAMITELLLLQQAKEKNINVSEELKNQLAVIKKQNNFSTDEDLRRAVEQQGIPYDTWLKQFEDTLLKQAVLITEVYRTIVLDDAEVVQYYKQHPQEFTVPEEFKLGAIYVATSGRTPESVEDLKAEISGKLKSGGAFGDVAAQLSDPPLKEAKGELGTFKKSELDPILVQAAEKTKAGEISPWVETKNGWYLIRVEEKRDSYLKSFDAVRGEVQDKLLAEKRQKKSDEYIASLRAQSYIKILNADPLGD
jgi:peptidyl-prolyl cis-trans isomerase SurA